MITFLSSPKPFKGDDKTNQYQAIRSWKKAAPAAEIILYGDSDGIDEAGRDLDVKVVKDIESSPSGIPYFNAIVSHAAAKGQYELQVYLNCDILLSGVHKTLSLIEFPHFLLVGERIDLDRDVPFDIDGDDWRTELRRLAQLGKANVHGPTGIDYFAFRRGTWKDLPSIIIGRAGYDNAIIAHCKRNSYPVIDGTFSILALHQFHDYKHVAGEKKTVFFGDEALQNFAAAGGRRSATMVSDADYVIRNGQIVPWPCRGDLLRNLELKLRYRYGFKNAWLVLRAVWRSLEALGVVRIRRVELKDLI